MNKKINIGIVVFAVVVAVSSVVMAETGSAGYGLSKLNTLRSVNLDSAASIYSGDASMAVPEPSKPEPVIDSDPIVVSDKDVMARNLDWYIKVAIAYSETSGQFNVKSNLIKLLWSGTLEEKYAFVYNKGDSYKFPERLISRYPGQQICVASHQEQECVNQLVCRMVCAAAGAAVGGVAGAVGAVVCNQVCESRPPDIGHPSPVGSAIL